MDCIYCGDEVVGTVNPYTSVCDTCAAIGEKAGLLAPPPDHREELE